MALILYIKTYSENTEERDHSYTGGDCKRLQPLAVWHFLTKLNLQLPYNPVIAPLGIYPWETEIYSHTKTCTQVFVTALFLLAKMETTQMSFNG